MKKGDWVAGNNGHQPALGKIKEVHPDGALDIVLYDHDGDRIGRGSPAMGGPKGFEPYCHPSLWRRIELPNFPLPRAAWGMDLVYIDPPRESLL